MPLFTVGHSNHTPQRLFEIIAPFGITHLIDIRSVPYSGRFPHFNRDTLAELCADRGIVYEWWGETLGGVRGTDEGLASVAATSPFRNAVGRVAKSFAGDESGRTACLLCAEWDPRKCHRAMLVGPALRSLPDGGVDLHHILPDGKLILQSELEEEQDVPRIDRAGTLSLFD